MATSHTSNAIRVVWICHFTDLAIQKHLKPHRSVKEYAPWIINTLNKLDYPGKIEIHVIAPHQYIPWTRKFKVGNIRYFFYNPGIPLWGRHWPNFFRWDMFTNYAHHKRIVNRIVESINPDIIHLQGAENPYYSSTILQFITRYPVVINLQRMSLDFFFGNSKFGLRRALIENEILTRFSYFSVRTLQMQRDLLSINKVAKTYWVEYALPEIKPQTSEKKYDIVFFARISKDKGIEDLIHALPKVKQAIPQVTLCIMGGDPCPYTKFLQEMAESLDVDDRIVWMGRLSTQAEVHKLVSMARVCVLPTHYDTIPGTILESMQLGLPVVSYIAGSISELNSERENVLLVKIGDIQGLADNIIKLLTDKECYSVMSKRGIDLVEEMFGNANFLEQHLDCYNQVIEDFHKGSFVI